MKIENLCGAFGVELHTSLPVIHSLSDVECDIDWLTIVGQEKRDTKNAKMQKKQINHSYKHEDKHNEFDNNMC
jgi:hypothetical protein